MHARDDWPPVVDLIERVVGEDDLLPSVVATVRTMVQEIAALPSADIAGHTRALLAAATRALAARRGPTEAELSFVEELAVTRARQGVSIESVLAAVHVAERAIWSRARELAAGAGVAPERLLDARELYDDWAEAVRGRLITAHRATGADREPPSGGRDAALLRRLFAGGSAAALAAAEAGLPAAGGLWVLVARPEDAAAAPERAPRDPGAPALSALVDGLLVAVHARRPPARTARAVRAGAAAGLAGPGDPEGLAFVRRLAVAALAAAEAAGRSGVVHIAEVAALAAVVDRADLAAVLLDRHEAALTGLGANAGPVALAVRAWLETDRDVPAAAERLFVHPNTVRNRIQRFSAVTGIDPAGTFGAVDAWWLCRAWLARS
ncbi:helix-turn-helix domain-containing protein [Streptomyces sp. WAC 00631]|uniref:helix-turn-helix domain-containing protein n=1 Tax=unclassified Streptomyces TaxID=2593676 RepID=UPI000F772D06|nr:MULTISPECIES: helix-turn-helix domain-containing protein [unclassified Streptomyces]MCC5037018.1 helix-turn-helix domain-containing protein [Streptomyces sp. WAC 00631]MCC9737626.1 helix-turn-helix domain-containing protein [Streptomyces sp. MNU89]